MTRRYIAEKWESFSAAAMLHQTSSIQQQEMRRAFYAGFTAALSINMEIGDPSVPEEEGVEILNKLHEECAQFAHDIGNGKA